MSKFDNSLAMLAKVTLKRRELETELESVKIMEETLMRGLWSFPEMRDEKGAPLPSIKGPEGTNTEYQRRRVFEYDQFMFEALCPEQLETLRSKAITTFAIEWEPKGSEIEAILTGHPKEDELRAEIVSEGEPRFASCKRTN